VIRASYDDGMVDFTESLRRPVEAPYVGHPTAYEAAPDPDERRRALKGIPAASIGILG